MIEDIMQELVSIIIVSYNGKRFLQKCFESLFSQSYKNVEVILVDNGSSDDSIAYTNKYFPKVKVVNPHANTGFAQGNNIGVKHAKGKYLFLLNNDAWVDHDTITNLVKEYKDSIGILGPTVYNPDGSLQSEGINIDRFGYSVSEKENIPKDPFYVLGAGMFMSRALFNKAGGFDERYFMFVEEVDLAWRVRLLGYKVKVAPDAAIYHIGGGSLFGGKAQKGAVYKTNTRRVYLRERNTITTLLKNYQLTSLLYIIPSYISLNIAEMLFFLLRMQPNISYLYLRAWVWNIKNMKGTLKLRQKIQHTRKISDQELFSQQVIYKKIRKLELISIVGVPKIDKS